MGGDNAPKDRPGRPVKEMPTVEFHYTGDEAKWTHMLEWIPLQILRDSPFSRKINSDLSKPVKAILALKKDVNGVAAKAAVSVVADALSLRKYRGF